MESFEENFNSKTESLLENLKKFTEKKNNAAGTRARKNAQELKSLLQELRVSILDEQKTRKESKGGGSKQASASS